MPNWLKDKLRLIVASLIFWGGLMICILIASTLSAGKIPAELLGVGFAIFFVCLFLAVYKLFSPSDIVEALEEQQQARVQKLERSGLLEVTSFRATRAFQVEEFEDEGSSYFIEVENGAVLFMSGQYLYDYDPIDDDSEIIQLRRFPCTEFTVKRDHQNNECVDLLCEGEVIEPEMVVPPFNEDDFRKDRVPEDGQIITHRTYDDFKQERLHRRS